MQNWLVIWKVVNQLWEQPDTKMKREIMNKTYVRMDFYDCRVKNARVVTFPGYEVRKLFAPLRQTFARSLYDTPWNLNSFSDIITRNLNAKRS